MDTGRSENLNKRGFTVEKKGDNRKFVRIICGDGSQAGFVMGYHNQKYTGTILNINYESMACSISGNFEFRIEEPDVIMVINLYDIRCKLHGKIKIVRTVLETLHKWNDVYVIQYDKSSAKESTQMVHDFINTLIRESNES
jgi:hypothetical protein